MTWQELYKGDVSGPVAFKTGLNDGDCGVSSDNNEDYLVALFLDEDGDLQATSCGLNVAWDEVSDTLLDAAEGNCEATTGVATRTIATTRGLDFRV